MNKGQSFFTKFLRQCVNQRIILLIVVCLGVIGLLTAGSPEGKQSEKPENAVGFYTKNGETVWIVPGRDIKVTMTGKLSPSEMETLFPMSPEDEAKIVHIIPSCPVIIDGIKYKPEEINLFNGKRLWFIVGPDGNLYAFTTTEGLERFQVENRPVSIMSDGDSLFYWNIWYSGESFGLAPGYGFPYLSDLGFDNAVSSVRATPTAAWTYIFDDTGYQGDSFAMAGGSNYSMLYFQGWNDRASSAWVSSY